MSRKQQNQHNKKPSRINRGGLFLCRLVWHNSPLKLVNLCNSLNFTHCQNLACFWAIDVVLYCQAVNVAIKTRNIYQRKNRRKEDESRVDKLFVFVNGITASRKSKEIAELLQCSTQTVAARLKNPDTMTVGELKSLCKHLGVRLDDLRQAITY